MKDLTGYKLVFSDDFDQGKLDETAWNSELGDLFPDQLSFDDTCMHIRGEYKDGKSGPYWYGSRVRTRKLYNKGYFECRCKPSHALRDGMWCAFFILTAHPYDPKLSRGGRDGTEVDVFECFTGTDGVEYIESTVHCGGMEKRLRASKDLDSMTFVRFVPDNLCSEFHTFGLDWDDNEYTVYMDGVKLASTSWGDGTCSTPAEIIVSLEPPANRNFTEDHTLCFDYAVDWVKIWQK